MWQMSEQKGGWGGAGRAGRGMGSDGCLTLGLPGSLQTEASLLEPVVTVGCGEGVGGTCD